MQSKHYQLCTGRPCYNVTDAYTATQHNRLIKSLLSQHKHQRARTSKAPNMKGLLMSSYSKIYQGTSIYELVTVYATTTYMSKLIQYLMAVHVCMKQLVILVSSYQ